MALEIPFQKQMGPLPWEADESSQRQWLLAWTRLDGSLDYLGDREIKKETLAA